MMAHTPGPWFVGPHYRSDVESREGRVCECGPLNSPRAVANARLIAFTPALIRVLRKLESATRDTLETHPETECCGVTRAAADEARALLSAINGAPEGRHAPTLMQQLLSSLRETT